MPDRLQAIEEQLKDAGRKTAILDSNLLVVWISGRLGLAGKVPFKRVKGYSIEDMLLLEWILGRFSGVVTTSGVLAETSNLANELSDPLRTKWFAALAYFSVITEEAHVGTNAVGGQNEFVRFGFTDGSGLSRFDPCTDYSGVPSRWLPERPRQTGLQL